ncbi:unnamed protein product [Blumeria hordei]|uniref:Uncharacterized protein n=2 Tax=Blumeria hordei TaxID=2867405 RepID=A0A383UYH6_BLUHO|nr:unamed protein/c6 zinc finger domain containing protein [Blumeria hordei DH14]SZF04809.1 unnamed protein product [Blumeria hordei]
MQSLLHRQDNLRLPLGERRKKSDLGRFCLDLSWAREVPDSARSRAYPSPPMSGSPTLPSRPNIDASERGHGAYVSGVAGTGVYRGLPTPQLDQPDQRSLAHRIYTPLPEPATSIMFTGPYRSDHMPNPQQHQTQIHTLPHLSQHPEFSAHTTTQPSFTQASYPVTGRPLAPEQVGFTSPKQQRKTKGHVASACVPSQRPCSRCVSNGKEDACVDVQHKKRGRPRLRDERVPRYDGITHGYSNDLMRRPQSFYSQNEPAVSIFGANLQQRPGEYRILKSHGASINNNMPKYSDHSSASDTGIYISPQAPNSRPLAHPEPAYAFLSLDMVIIKSTPSFGETIGTHSIVNRPFQDIVTPNEREKVIRLQRTFEEERREREPNYLPPIYLSKFEEDRVIQAIGFGIEDLGHVRIDRQEMLTFQAPDGQQRTFQVRMGLAKKTSTYFIVVLLHIPTSQVYNSPSMSYTRESHSRDSQYGYQSSLQGFSQNSGSSSYPTSPAYSDGRLELPSYRTPCPIGPSIAYNSTGITPFYQPHTRIDYNQPQASYQVPRSELIQASQSRPNDLQLPPIRDPIPHRDSVKGRLDIGGLLESTDIGSSRG